MGLSGSSLVRVTSALLVGIASPLSGRGLHAWSGIAGRGCELLAESYWLRAHGFSVWSGLLSALRLSLQSDHLKKRPSRGARQKL